MGDLSRNFSRKEFRCRCCDRAYVSPRLVAALQDLRDLAGGPVRITSGFRCPDHNWRQGGTPRSQHLLGTAADVVIAGHGVLEMYCLADRVAAFRNGGLGLYPDDGILHVDVRGEHARWGRVEGEYVTLARALSATAAPQAPDQKPKGDQTYAPA